jgi:hypothetical protein
MDTKSLDKELLDSYKRQLEQNRKELLTLDKKQLEELLKASLKETNKILPNQNFVLAFCLQIVILFCIRNLR